MTCDKPPLGWKCTRDAGHDGPCAALPEEAKPEPEGRADRLNRYLLNPHDHLLDKSPYGDLVMFTEAAAAIRVLEGKLARAKAARSVEHKGEHYGS